MPAATPTDSANETYSRRLPIGAEIVAGRGVHFRVWAPASGTAAVKLTAAPADARGRFPLAAEPGGYSSGLVPGLGAGANYRIEIDGGAFPDPASRFQPDGPHGPSEVVDPHFAWTDDAWRGRPAHEWVIYELHLGTFTRAGTWRAAMAELPELVRVGITLIEVMPVAEFPGQFGWGYDGVGLFAPSHLYGRPEDARAFVNRAHELGLGVILDVVYNHIGPDGNYLTRFSPDYFSKRYRNEWGDPLNFDGENAASVREFFLSNVHYWIEEFHLDGLRLDATQQIYDASPTHFLAELTRVARAAAGGREVFIVGENESQHARLARSHERGGYGLDALWSDDFHHSAHVNATGHAEAYYSGFRGTAQEFVSAIKRGFLYQGQWYRWQGQRRGRPALDLPARQFVFFLENHDQVANSLRGLRLHQQTSPGKFRALTALLLLAPEIPLLFQGQEFGSSAPFLYFADHRSDLAQQVSDGRRAFLRQFRSVAAPESQAVFAMPHERATFERCRLDFAERERHGTIYRLHIDLLACRRTDPAIAAPAGVDGAVLGDDAFVLRYLSNDGADDRLLLVNLGRDLHLEPAPEPLLAPLEGRGWRTLWSSEAPEYGGRGTPPLETKSNWLVPGACAVLLGPNENDELPAARFSEKD